MTTRSSLRPTTVIMTCVLMTLLLTGCSFLGGNDSQSSTKATPTTQSAAATNFQTYQGEGYTIQYPQGWKQTNNNGLISFSDPLGITTLLVENIANPNSTVPPTKAVDLGLQGLQGQMKNYKKVEIAPTTTVGGETWNQGAGTGDITSNGQTVNGKFIVIATNHPDKSPSTKLYTLVYGTASQLFDGANTSYFQPMLKSFKFQ